MTDVALRALELFAGIGGLPLALRGYARTVCYVEVAPYAVEVLRSRIRAGQLDDAPIWDDVATFDGRPWRGSVDLVSGGFPCPPVSIAGKKLGRKDPRWLWPQFARIVGEVRPRFVFVENPTGLFTADDGAGFAEVLGDLSAMGFDAEWGCLSAADVGAPHLRERIWILADAERGDVDGIHPRAGRAEGIGQEGSRGQRVSAPPSGPLFEKIREAMALADRARRGERRGSESVRTQHGSVECSGEGPWCCDPADRTTEPRVGRLAHGVPSRVDRLRCLGNAVVPQTAQEAFERLMWRVWWQ